MTGKSERKNQPFNEVRDGKRNDCQLSVNNREKNHIETVSGVGPQRRRVTEAFAHRAPDRTPLFEIFWPYHPIYWDVCGRNIATDMAMAWDAHSDNISWEEEVDALARADVSMARFFELDMVLVGESPQPNDSPVEKTGTESWRRNGIDHAWNPLTCRVEPVNAGAESGNWVLHGTTENDFRRQVEASDPDEPPALGEWTFARLKRVRELLAELRLDLVCMVEIGAGTAAAQYPPSMWIWMIEEPQLYERWLQAELRRGLAIMEGCVRRGADVVALGGDISSDQGPLISPDLYSRYVLPAVQRQIELVHQMDAYAVYTSDGNLWPIRDEFFFRSGADGYKEVDFGAGMTMERLVHEGIKEQVTVIGNIDARHAMCNGTAEEIRKHTLHCLDWGLRSPGGHILHTSHSVHEGMPADSYYTAWETYRERFGLPARRRLEYAVP